MAFTVYAFLLLSAMWLLFDIRMSTQYLSWVIHDYQTYSGQSEETRTFRDRKRFYDFAEAAAMTVNDRERYIFYAQHDWPFLGNVRYITYPVLPTGIPRKDDTWVIYDRPDVSVNEDGSLEYDGQVLSSPGKVLLQFDEVSFIFREAL